MMLIDLKTAKVFHADVAAEMMPAIECYQNLFGDEDIPENIQDIIGLIEAAARRKEATKRRSDETLESEPKRLAP